MGKNQVLENRFMSTGEAAGMLGRSVQTIRDWVDRGILRGRRIERPGYKSARLVERASVVQFAEGYVAVEPERVDRREALRRLREETYRKMGKVMPG